MDVHDLLALAQNRYDDYLTALEAMVNVDCGTFSKEGVNRVADMCEERFRQSGWDVRRHQHEPEPGEPSFGDLVIGTVRGSGGPKILLVGHTDTVFDDGTAAERPFRTEGATAYGPGVSDMKGGLLLGFFACRALQDAGFDGFESITYVCNPDEEIGSPFSTSYIRELAAQSDFAFVLEGARANGDIVSARKGVSDFHVAIHGRAAHAGVEPEKGRSAVLEAAHKVIALQDLNGTWPGVTVNVGVIEGGTRTNVIPERCELRVDLRATELATLEEAERRIAAICAETTVPDVRVETTGHGWFRPMEKTEAIAMLVGHAKTVAAELGFDLDDASTGGASDANSIAAAGTPVLDGMGPIGGDDHAPGEWLDLGSVIPRTALLAGVITRL